MSSTEKVRALRRKRAEAGLCVYCGVNPPPLAGAARRCPACILRCREYTKQNRQKSIEKRAKWVAAGMCMYCGKYKATHGKRCKRCRSRDNAKHKEWMKETRSIRGTAALCAECGKADIASHSESRCSNCLAQNAKRSPTQKQRKAEYGKNYAKRLRLQVIAHYSKGRFDCNCCGERELLFLSIDHVNNNGSAHRNALGVKPGTGLYRYIINNDFPQDFQILCHNCNHGKHLNGGICPHKVQQQSHVQR